MSCRYLKAGVSSQQFSSPLPVLLLFVTPEKQQNPTMSSPNEKKTMRAVIYEGKPFEIKVRDWPKPTIQMPEDAIVRITTSGLCGSEAHIYRGLMGSHNPPWVMGHEGVGIVVEVGSATEQFKVGDRVLIPFGTDSGHLVVESTTTPDIPMYGAGEDFRPDASGHQGMSLALNTTHLQDQPLLTSHPQTF
jgi:hypothetical protein